MIYNLKISHFIRYKLHKIIEEGRKKKDEKKNHELQPMLLRSRVYSQTRMIQRVWRGKRVDSNGGSSPVRIGVSRC